MDMMIMAPLTRCEKEKEKEKEEEKKKGKGKSSLYFCVLKRTTKELACLPPISLHWYATDLSLVSSSSDSDFSSGNEEIKRLLLPSILPPIMNMMSPPAPSVALHHNSCVVLDSVIYIIGGSPPRNSERIYYSPYNYSFNVLYFDTRHPKGGCWKYAPPMMAARVEPAAYAVDGKIYVFGGGYEGNYPYGEVFDPNLWDSGWKPLPSIQSNDNDFRASWVMPVHQADDYRGHPNRTRRRRRLLLHLIVEKSLYSFDLDSKTWTQLDTEFGSWYHPLVSVGDFLYGYKIQGTYNIFAYNVGKRKWLSNPVQGFQLLEKFPPYCDNFPVFLLYLGNRKFCFTWSLLSPSIGCTVFTIDVAGDQEIATAKIESFNIYQVDDGTDYCIHCVAL